MQLKTKRLILRPLKDSDAKSVQENINNIEVSKWLLVVKYPYTLKDAKSWIKHNKEKWKSKKKDDYSFGIELRQERKVIGGMGIHKVKKDQGTAELGYWLGANYHRKGYGSEALKAVLDFAFKKLKLRRIAAGVYVGNPSSGKLFEKFGAKQEGFLRKARICKADGKIKDEILYGLLREEYKLKK